MHEKLFSGSKKNFIRFHPVSTEWQRDILDDKDPFWLYRCLVNSEPINEAVFTTKDDKGTPAIVYYLFQEQMCIEFRNIFTKDFLLKNILYFSQKNTYGSNFYHYVGASGNKEAIAYLLSDQLPEAFRSQLEAKNKYGENFLHYVALSGNKEAIAYLLSDQFPEAFRSQLEAKNKYGENFLHYVALSGNKEAIAYILSDQCPEALKPLLYDKNNFGANFLHYVALSGNKEAIAYVLSDQLPKELKPLLYDKDNDGRNFMHYVAESGNPEGMQYLLTFHPAFCEKLWVKDNNGDSLNELWPNETACTPSTILKDIAKNIFKKFSDPNAVLDQNEKEFVVAFKDRIDDFLRHPDFLSPKEVAECANHPLVHKLFSEKIKLLVFCHKLENSCSQAPDLSTLLVILACKSQFIESILPKGSSLLLFMKKKGAFTDFLDNIKKIVLSIGESPTEEFLDQLAITINLLCNYTNASSTMTQEEKIIFNTISRLIFKMPEVDAIIPKIKEEAGWVITSEKIPGYLDQIKKAIETSGLTEEIRDGSLRVLEGIRYLLNNFDKINEFAKTHQGRQDILYFLDKPDENLKESPQGKLPFHLGEYGVDQPLKNTIERTIVGYIAGFLKAEELGKTKEFLERSTGGFCLDMRIRDLGTWLTKISEPVKSIHDLMSDCVKEYFAYLTVVDRAKRSADNPDPDNFADFILKFHPGIKTRDEKNTIVPLSKKMIVDYVVDYLGWKRRFSSRFAS